MDLRRRKSLDLDGSRSLRAAPRDSMSNCHIQHCDEPHAVEHPVHGIHLCERCHELVEQFGHPRTLGDLSKLITLALLNFGPKKVRAALNSLERLG